MSRECTPPVDIPLFGATASDFCEFRNGLLDHWAGPFPDLRAVHERGEVVARGSANIVTRLSPSDLAVAQRHDRCRWSVRFGTTRHRSSAIESAVLRTSKRRPLSELEQVVADAWITGGLGSKGVAPTLLCTYLQFSRRGVAGPWGAVLTGLAPASNLRTDVWHGKSNDTLVQVSMVQQAFGVHLGHVLDSNTTNQLRLPLDIEAALLKKVWLVASQGLILTDLKPGNVLVVRREASSETSKGRTTATSVRFIDHDHPYAVHAPCIEPKCAELVMLIVMHGMLQCFEHRTGAFASRLKSLSRSHRACGELATSGLVEAQPKSLKKVTTRGRHLLEQDASMVTLEDENTSQRLLYRLLIAQRGSQPKRDARRGARANAPGEGSAVLARTGVCVRTPSCDACTSLETAMSRLRRKGFIDWRKKTSVRACMLTPRGRLRMHWKPFTQDDYEDARRYAKEYYVNATGHARAGNLTKYNPAVFVPAAELRHKKILELARSNQARTHDGIVASEDRSDQRSRAKFKAARTKLFDLQ